jgi:hypothetical protein
MKEILLLRGKGKTIVDDQDFDYLIKFKWHLHEGYACRMKRENGKAIRTRMHREILGAIPGDGKIIDHINRNRLDNRRSNLRFCSFSENALNTALVPGRTGYKGVTVCKNKNAPYRAQFCHKGKKIWIGDFHTPELAFEAYQEFKSILLKSHF